MKKAAQYLIEKKYTIGEIAYLVGFRNTKYFSTAFKRYYGVSPSLYPELDETTVSEVANKDNSQTKRDEPNL